MAFDGIVVSNIVHELQQKLIGGRITKISQPEKDELIITIKNYDQFKLFLSANASLPLIYLTESSKPNPMTAPNFCMLLRKHLNSARIIEISQPGLERIIQIKIEHLSEMGDPCIKYLIVEIMGKHSNIIFCDDSFKIVDSIKHVSSFVSSVREVLPGRDYFIPLTSEKQNPLDITFEVFKDELKKKAFPIAKALYSTLTGFSPLIAGELCHRASLDSQLPISELSEDYFLHLFHNLERFREQIKKADYTPNIIYRRKEPIEFSSVSLSCYSDFIKPLETTSSATAFQDELCITFYTSISNLLEEYYSSKNLAARIRQKSADLRHVVSNAIERDSKKYDLQLKQLKDTDKREKYKIYGELLTTYGYQAETGAEFLICMNYYTNEEIKIPLDPLLSPMENAKKYFEKYSKLKRTAEAMISLVEETKTELEHLDSIRTALDIAVAEEDLIELKEELMDYGFIKRHYNTQKNGQKNMKKVKITSKPFHFISSDGYHMYVGKNNYQNDELTFRFATGNDWWFHAKGIPGSHVIVKCEGTTLPDQVFEEAARLAAYFSKGREGDKVEIDYTEKKNVKKPSGGKPGFVVYYTNYSMMANPDISGISVI